LTSLAPAGDFFVLYGSVAGDERLKDKLRGDQGESDEDYNGSSSNQTV